MLNLVLPVDGSPAAEKAARYVVSLAGHVESLSVRVVNVQPRMEAWEVARFLKTDEVGEWQRRCGEDQTAGVLQILSAAGISCTVEILTGNIADTIVQYSQDHECGLIVMGARGLGPLEGLLLGSVTASVLRHADIPVTLVR